MLGKVGVALTTMRLALRGVAPILSLGRAVVAAAPTAVAATEAVVAATAAGEDVDAAASILAAALPSTITS